jgi:hypothetical protein
MGAEAEITFGFIISIFSKRGCRHSGVRVALQNNQAVAKGATGAIIILRKLAHPLIATHENLHFVQSDER